MLEQNKITNFQLHRLSVLRYRLTRADNAVALSGIQRSGTNFVTRCLDDLNVVVLNGRRLDERLAAHKHVRWNSQEHTNIPYLKPLFPIHTSTSILDINNAAGYPARTRHLIVKKEKLSWMRSIVNFSLRSNWFPDIDTALKSVEIFSIDYENYYAFWQMRQTENDSACQVIHLEDVILDPGRVVTALDRMGIRAKTPIPVGLGRYDEVNMSPSHRQEYVTSAQILDKISELDQ